MKPIQLISFGLNKKLQLQPQAINWLQSIPTHKNIGVITVVGKYRTGKSYILNRVLLNQNSGFEVGPTINACTKGLWVWPQLIQSDSDPHTLYIVMDTEGLGSLQEGEQSDTKIFLMAMLLSSYFIYNSLGSIDEKALQSLSLVVNLSKLLQKGDSKAKQTILQCFPSFLWLVRDFSLRLVDTNNHPISPKQYLENALQPQKGTSEMVSRKNNIRKELVSFFRERDCFTLIRPVDDESKLQNMSKVREEDLRPKFKLLVKELRNKIMQQAKSKKFKGKSCSPSMFVELCQHFCQSINNGTLPEIDNHWSQICKSENKRIEKWCSSEFEKFMKNYENQRNINFNQFERESSKKVTELLAHYQKSAIGEKQEKKKEMKQVMQGHIQQFKKNVSKRKNQLLQENLQSLTIKVEALINANSIESVFEITDEYDQLIQSETKQNTSESMLFLYQKSYQGLKNNVQGYFGTILQTEKFEKALLSDRIQLYKESLNRIQKQYTKKTQESDERQRELRQNIYKLQINAQRAQFELEKAKKQLKSIKK